MDSRAHEEDSPDNLLLENAQNNMIGGTQFDNTNDEQVTQPPVVVEGDMKMISQQLPLEEGSAGSCSLSASDSINSNQDNTWDWEQEFARLEKSFGMKKTHNSRKDKGKKMKMSQSQELREQYAIVRKKKLELEIMKLEQERERFELEQMKLKHERDKFELEREKLALEWETRKIEREKIQSESTTKETKPTYAPNELQDKYFELLLKELRAAKTKV